VSFLRWLSRYKMLLVLAMTVVALTAVAAASFTHFYVQVLHDAFRERSTAYAHAFAAAARPWVSRVDVEMVRSAAQLILAGSALYVQIANENGFLIDERTATAQPLVMERKAEVLSSSLSLVARPGGGSHLDILIPLSPSDGTDYVRIGIDRAAVTAQSSGAIAVASGAAFGFDIFLLLVLIVAWRTRRRGSHEGALVHGENLSGDAIVTVGALEIDSRRKAVRLQGQPVRLTPKQFTLLELLASQPGRVFSEREILEAAWPDSPYADAKDIKQYVYLVCRRLSDVDPGARNLIETVPGFGYRLASEDVDPEMT